MRFVFTAGVVTMDWTLAGKKNSLSISTLPFLFPFNLCFYGAFHSLIFYIFRIDSKEKRQLIQEYMSADEYRRRELEKRYGRIQLKRMVDTLLDDQYLRDNASKCPNCNTFIQKTEGCNKMTCLK